MDTRVVRSNIAFRGKHLARQEMEISFLVGQPEESNLCRTGLVRGRDSSAANADRDQLQLASSLIIYFGLRLKVRKHVNNSSVATFGP